MPFSSPFPDLDIPQTDILTYLFPPNKQPSNKPIWIDAADPAKRLSPAQLLQWVKRLAFGIEKAGVMRGEVVMIFTPNSILVPVAYLGIVGAGCAFSGANPIYTINEMVHQMSNTEAKMLLVHPSLLKTAVEAAVKAGIPKNKIYQFSDDGECPVRDGIQDWRKMLGTPEQGNRYKWKKLDGRQAASTVATINYSSGTTGLPKGVCVSHLNLVSHIEQTIFAKFHLKPFKFEDRPEERWIGFLPLYHAYGQLYAVLMACKLEAAVYIMKQFVYTDFLAAIQKYKITTLQAAPPILVMLNKRPETSNYDLSSIKDVLVGAAPLSKETQNEVAKKFNCMVCQGWGMTEVTCGAIVCPGGLYDDSGSVGQLIPNTKCKLVDEDEKEVAMGQPGELWIQGPQVCMRYWKNEKATKESITPDGWLKTGDVAVCNDRGFFWIVDRKKELIKVNALQVAPAELESVLLENDNIADAAVVGIKLHEEEFPRAYVVLQDKAKGKVKPEEIQEWIKPRVAKHKHLVGGVSIVDEIPRLASGKIQRKVMREWSKRDAKEMEGKVKARL